MPSYTEEDVMNAIHDVTENGVSLSKAAAQHAVPKITLSHRMNGIAAKSETIQPAQRLSPAEENRVVQWIKRQESLGYAPSAAVVRQVVEAIMKKRGDMSPLGKHWIEAFKARHEDIQTKISRPQEAARFDGFTPKAVH